MSDNALADLGQFIRYEARWQVLICRPCQAAVCGAKTALIRHLRSKHHMSFRDYRPLVDAVSALPCCSAKAQFPCPLDDGPPIDDLPSFPVIDVNVAVARSRPKASWSSGHISLTSIPHSVRLERKLMNWFHCRPGARHGEVGIGRLPIRIGWFCLWCQPWSIMGPRRHLVCRGRNG